MKALLHVLNKPADHPRFRRCIAAIGPGDSLVLREAAALALHEPGAIPDDGSFHLYVIQRDLETIMAGNEPPGQCRPVDDRGFIQLICEHQAPIFW